MGKATVSNFDQRICTGEHPDVDGACPHLQTGDDDADGGLVSRLARAETKAIETATGDEPGRCGLCHCPLPNLELTARAPVECPRINLHDR